MNDFLLIGFIGLASFLNLVATIAFLRARDIFTMTHITMIFNSYVIPICLIAIELQGFANLSLLKILAISAVNIIIANILCYLIIQRATLNNIQPDAEIIED